MRGKTLPTEASAYNSPFSQETGVLQGHFSSFVSATLLKHKRLQHKNVRFRRLRPLCAGTCGYVLLAHSKAFVGDSEYVRSDARPSSKMKAPGTPTTPTSPASPVSPTSPGKKIRRSPGLKVSLGKSYERRFRLPKLRPQRSSAGHSLGPSGRAGLASCPCQALYYFDCVTCLVRLTATAPLHAYCASAHVSL